MADNYLEKKMEDLQARKAKEARAKQIAWKKRMDAYRKKLEAEAVAVADSDMIPDWAKEMNGAVTVCDKDGVVLYMNDKAKETFASYGDLVGKNLMGCHSERSKEIIRSLLESGGSNAYTIEKNGLRKMIYQTAWKENGVVAGLVEISMVIPSDMPHYVRG